MLSHNILSSPIKSHLASQTHTKRTQIALKMHTTGVQRAKLDRHNMLCLFPSSHIRSEPTNNRLNNQFRTDQKPTYEPNQTISGVSTCGQFTLLKHHTLRLGNHCCHVAPFTVNRQIHKIATFKQKTCGVIGEKTVNGPFPLPRL